MNIHKFWSTQPVPQSTESTAVKFVGPVDRPKTVDDVSTVPLPIASSFEWCTPDFTKTEDLRAVYELLRDNYVEDRESMFRFNYSEEFLRWALTPPGYVPSWHVGVRRKEDKTLLGFVAGVPITMRMGTPRRVREERDKSDEKGTSSTGEANPSSGDAQAAKGEDHLDPHRICEINFLCVKKNLREKRMAPILIQEVTRRVNLTNVWQAVYTSGTLLPTPFSTGQYYHRNLNPEKLIGVRFSSMPAQFTKFQNPLSMIKRFYQLPSEPKTRGLRVMERRDVPAVRQLLQEELATYDVAPVFTEEEVEHLLLPRENVVVSWVVERDVEGNEPSAKGQKKVTDFFSFFSLPSTIIGNSKYSTLNAAYLLYYAARTVPLTQLIGDLLTTAQRSGYDVCNMVSILKSDSFVKDLKFGEGDGCLHYYFYNWSYPHLKSSEVGLVML